MRAFAGLLLVCGVAGAARAQPFVRVDGTGFRAGAQRLRFLGANLELLHGATHRAPAAVEETLAAAQADGLTVGRVWALGEGPADAPPSAREDHLFRAGPDDFVEGAYLQLDRVLASARAHHIRLILTLANYWGDYGGVPAYLAWAGLPTDGWGAGDRFFSDARTRAFYRAHLAKLLARTNSVTGVRYVDDPTIFAWELMNESRVDTEAGAAARRSWIREMARTIRARDRHHLITPGLIGYSSLKERAEWLAVCRLPQVDYCDSHLYPQTTDRVSVEDGDPAAAAARLAAYIDDRAQLAAHVAHKPLVIGEFGFRTDEPDVLGEARARWFERLLARVALDGVAGALVWIYQPWTGQARDFGIYVDRQDTDDVRAVLRAWAARLLRPAPAHNPLLGARAGDRPMYEPYQTLRRPETADKVARSDDGPSVALRLDPAAFAAARWERVGTWDGGALAHAYGADDGWFEWRFPGVGFVAARAQLAMRISSEFPGERAPPDGGSTVRVRVDGVALGTVDAVPDDGAGRVVRLPITDAALLGRLAAGAHTLRLEVAPGARAHGLCVYGAATGNRPAPDGELLPIELVFERR